MLRERGTGKPVNTKWVRERTDFLRKKLGDTAFWTFMILLRVPKDARGITRVTNASIARGGPGQKFAPIAQPNVRLAVRTLAKLGLLQTEDADPAPGVPRVLGWKCMQVPCGSGVAFRKIFQRRVLGCLVEGETGAEDIVMVSPEASKRIHTYAGRGGARKGAGGPGTGGRGGRRPGAGRKPKSANDVSWSVGQLPTKLQTAHTAEVETCEVVEAVANRKNQLQTAHIKLQTAHITPKESASNRAHDQTLHTLTNVSRTGSFPSLREGKDTPAAPSGSDSFFPESDPAPLQRSPGVSEETENGRVLRGVVRKQKTLGGPKHVPPELPRYPDIEQLGGMPVVPNPPLLAPEMSPYDKANTLAKLYRAVAALRYPDRPVFAFQHGRLVNSKHYPMLLAVAEALIEHEIAPAVWCLWSFDVWMQRSAGRGLPPPANFIWNVKRVKERHGWFAREENDYIGGRAIIPTELRELYRMHQAAVRAANLAMSPEEASAAVRRVLPEGAWEDAEERARNAVVRIKRDLQERVESGEVVWAA